MGLKKAFLNKGWAGRTISRPETVDRFNPLLKAHHRLNFAYDFLINHVADIEVASILEAQQKTARTDIAKLSESVLSAGGVSYSGVDLDPESIHLSGNDGTMIQELLDLEQEFQSRLTDELELDHQIRSRAILSIVQANSAARLEYLRKLSRNYRRG